MYRKRKTKLYYLGVRVSTLTSMQRERKTKLYYLGVKVITLTKDRRRLS
jgi:hypothetical protein